MIPKELKQKLKYKAGEVAAAFGIEKSKLRYWEKKITIFTPERTEKGDRRYTKKDIETIALIIKLVKEENLTIKGANKRLNQKKTFDKFDLKKRLMSIGKELKNIEKYL